ncbi:MAG TPA: hypothetical protein VK665_18345 [Candidatus Elarobacter sp.]|nr:hypothetical protein [Candidatus Elarobacter sp.]
MNAKFFVYAALVALLGYAQVLLGYRTFMEIRSDPKRSPSEAHAVVLLTLACFVLVTFLVVRNLFAAFGI